ncbi:hypothetical protein MGWOODY_XGa1378 [hydrothermal vent metagenome]|uniref:Uncharacterized protein n=1 Tax=hydrothermal vent metagenome TaxID=652676 RepID=A0A160TTH8_9ZZZZ
MRFLGFGQRYADRLLPSRSGRSGALLELASWQWLLYWGQPVTVRLVAT